MLHTDHKTIIWEGHVIIQQSSLISAKCIMHASHTHWWTENFKEANVILNLLFS